MIFVDRSLLGLLWPLLADVRDRQAPRGDGRRQGDVPDDLDGGTTAARLRGAARRRRAGRVRTSTTRTGPRRCATRAARPATRRASSTRHRSTFLHTHGCDDRRQPRRAASATRSCRSCRCSTPTPGASPTPRVAGRRRPRDARARTCRAPAIADLISRRAGHGRRRRADDLDGRAARARRAATRRRCARSRAAARPCRRRCREAYREQIGLPILQAWGMTETSPIASVGPHQVDARRPLPTTSWPTCAPRSGVAVLGVELPGRRARHRRRRCRGTARRAASCRCAGPWIAARRTTTTSARPSRSPTTAGCKTGDVATIDADGYIRLVDRTKDLIKSGGEWISSVELENEIMAPPEGRRGRRHRRAAPEVGRAPAGLRRASSRARTLTKDEVLELPRRPRSPSGGCPTTSCSSTRCPKTSVGKFSKKDLRDRFADYSLPRA